MAGTAPGADVVLYTRKGCHLCDEAKQQIERARAQADFLLEIIDIDSDPELHDKFNEQVPVIFIDGRKALKFRVDAKDLLRRLKR